MGFESARPERGGRTGVAGTSATVSAVSQGRFAVGGGVIEAQSACRSGGGSSIRASGQADLAGAAFQPGLRLGPTGPGKGGHGRLQPSAGLGPEPCPDLFGLGRIESSPWRSGGGQPVFGPSQGAGACQSTRLGSASAGGRSTLSPRAGEEVYLDTALPPGRTFFCHSHPSP